MDIIGWNTPVYNAIKAYTDTNPLPFHMPGHKLGAGIPPEFLKEIHKLDLTEIPGTDNLHKPTGAIRDAQELLASAFGAQKSFFLVNGCTVGLHAAISAICRPGQWMVVGRDCHRAVINGLLIAGAVPVYVLPEYSDAFGVNTGITADAVRNALEIVPDAAGVLITRPNYYGVCSDVREIAKVVHSFGKPLVVDEAHGSHFAFHPELPEAALKAGADICIQSAHKTLPAFTQGAYLHIGSNRIDVERLEYFLDMFQTTSPSYVIMAFLDIAREIMQKNGETLLNGILDGVEAGRTKLADTGLKILSEAHIPGFAMDATRITINVSDLGMTGYDAEKLLRDKYNIQAEMSDPYNIVCISTVSDDAFRIGQLFTSLQALGRNARRCTGADKMAETGQLPGSADIAGFKSLAFEFMGLTLPDRILFPYEILNVKTEKIPLENAPGRISKGIISPYPPGMAIVCPGETFSDKSVDYLLRIRKFGGVVQGIDENGYVVVI